MCGPGSLGPGAGGGWSCSGGQLPSVSQSVMEASTSREALPAQESLGIMEETGGGPPLLAAERGGRRLAAVGEQV